MEKIWVGVKNLGGKNPKYGKNLVVGVILGQFWKIYHTFLGFFPYPPSAKKSENLFFKPKNSEEIKRFNTQLLFVE